MITHQHNFCANFSADVEIMVAGLFKLIFLPLKWLSIKLDSKSTLVCISAMIGYGLAVFAYVSAVMSLVFTSVCNWLGISSSIGPTNILVNTSNPISTSYIVNFINFYSSFISLIGLMAMMIAGISVLVLVCIGIGKLLKPVYNHMITPIINDISYHVTHRIAHGLKTYFVNVKDARLEKTLHQEK